MRKEPPPIEVQFGWAMADGWNEYVRIVVVGDQ
jgi:hypothetical protein